jgi:hypothetical protein
MQIGNSPIPASDLARLACIERLRDELNTDRERGTLEEVAALVRRGRKHFSCAVSTSSTPSAASFSISLPSC